MYVYGCDCGPREGPSRVTNGSPARRMERLLLGVNVAQGRRTRPRPLRSLARQRRQRLRTLQPGLLHGRRGRPAKCRRRTLLHRVDRSAHRTGRGFGSIRQRGATPRNDRAVSQGAGVLPGAPVTSLDGKRATGRLKRQVQKVGETTNRTSLRAGHSPYDFEVRAKAQRKRKGLSPGLVGPG